jgi:diguanylate cyclase (GGDEF)-like protein
MVAPEDPQEVILQSNEVIERKSELREEVKKSGMLEAVYKISAADGKTYWLKDQAKIEPFQADNIYISIGNLTIVTKEMEAEEHLKQVQKALRKSEQEFKKQAIHDNLTGLYNTRYLYHALDELIKKSASLSEVFSLVFMDIDNFKQVVDTHGHLNASKALQEIAATIKTSLQEPTYGVAYGGDEFVLVLPGFDKQQALDMAETIRKRIKETIYLQKKYVLVPVWAYPPSRTMRTRSQSSWRWQIRPCSASRKEAKIQSAGYPMRPPKAATAPETLFRMIVRNN